MKVLVTGATGFVGSALVKSLLASGHEVMALVREYSDRLPETVQQHSVGNFSELKEQDLARLLDCMVGVDVVVHAAGRAHMKKEAIHDPLLLYRQVNTEFTLMLARKVAAAGVKRFLFISTIGVNGNLSCSYQEYKARVKNTNSITSGLGNSSVGTPFQETDAPHPHNAYAQSKWEAEQGLKQLANETGLDVVIIRPPMVYGPKAPGNFGALVKCVRLGIPLPFGAVHNRRSLVALENLVSFVQLCMWHPKAANETFLIADGEDVSLTELLKKIAKAMGKKPHLISVPVRWMRLLAQVSRRKDLDIKIFGSLQIDISKAREELGWAPKVSMDDALKRVFSGRVIQRN